MKWLELFFENILWNTRFFVLLAVVFSMLGGITLFIVASVDVFGVVSNVIDVYLNHLHPKQFHEEVVGGIMVRWICILWQL